MSSSTSFKNRVTADGSSGFKAESGRYHLYISYACPFAHRTLVLRELKGLQDAVSVDVVYPHSDNGWSFSKDFEGTTGDTVNHCSHIREIYLSSNPEYVGRFTVPVLFDKKQNVIVNNESGDIIEMFNSEFNEFAKNPSLDFYPNGMKQQLDEMIQYLQDNINSGVYKCGFSKTQEDYKVAFTNLFNALDRVENMLSRQRYLFSNTNMTLADVRLFTTLLRFDLVYYILFKCNLKSIQFGYPSLWGFVRDIYQMDGIRNTIKIDHIKFGYFHSFIQNNPSQIVPIGPLIDFDETHGREIVDY